MDLDKLRALVELSRLGTMTAVAQATGYSPSAVSQQLSTLERQTGVALVEADGRRVRLTAAGRRLAEHGRGILAAVTAAAQDLATDTDPHGLVRVAGFTTALRQHVLPAMADLARRHPAMQLEVREGEPDEVESLLDSDTVDVGFVYDYTLVPRPWRHPHRLMSSSTIVLAVPDHLDIGDRIRTPADLDPLRDLAWIGNSRDTGDDELSARLCALAGWAPHVGHRADSLEVVVDLVVAGQGVSVLPSDSVEALRVRTIALDLADARRRMWSTVRAGTQQWPANNAVIDHIRGAITGTDPGPHPGDAVGLPSSA